MCTALVHLPETVETMDSAHHVCHANFFLSILGGGGWLVKFNNFQQSSYPIIFAIVKIKMLLFQKEPKKSSRAVQGVVSFLTTKFISFLLRADRTQ